MAIFFTSGYIIQTAILFGLLYSTQLAGSTQPDSSSTMTFRYHNGPLLRGRFSVNLIWYGSFKPAQRAVISDFLASLTSPPRREARPSVAAWWDAVGRYYRLAKAESSDSSTYLLSLSLGRQVIDEKCSAGKSLTMKQVEALASSKGGQQVNAINVVLTSDDVAVEGMCTSRCGTHASANKKQSRYPYVWVGNSGKQCPGQCAWPFHQPIYGPQGPPLVAPNNDVGLDGMVINLATLLAGTATNPFGNGYYQGPKEAPLEAATACSGVYGKGAYPGYAGQLLVDPKSGASYNANGVNGRKYLLPALYDPKTSTCFTLKSMLEASMDSTEQQTRTLVPLVPGAGQRDNHQLL
ncbi:hypothetical protein V2J09_008551 [Rumex salicifolius]